MLSNVLLKLALYMMLIHKPLKGVVILHNIIGQTQYFHSSLLVYYIPLSFIIFSTCLRLSGLTEIPSSKPSLTWLSISFSFIAVTAQMLHPKWLGLSSDAEAVSSFPLDFMRFLSDLLLLNLGDVRTLALINCLMLRVSYIPSITGMLISVNIRG